MRHFVSSHTRFIIAGSIFLIVTGSIAGILVPAGLGWDFANFYDTGRRVAAGQMKDIYDATTPINDEKPQGKLDFWGTPLSAYLYVPMSWLPPEKALIAFKIENALAYFIALILLYRHMQQFVPEGSLNRNLFAAQFAFAALLFQPIWTVYRVGGQTTATVFLLLVLALTYHYKGSLKLSALCYIAAVMIKPGFSTGLAFLMLASGIPFMMLATVLLGLIGLFSIALIGWPLHIEFLVKMLGKAGFVAPWSYNSSLYILTEQFKTWAGTHGGIPGLLSTFKVLNVSLKLGFLAAFAWLVVKSRPYLLSDQARRHFRFMLALLFFLMISQTLWEHYLTILFIPLSFVLATGDRFNNEARVIVWSIIILSIGQNLIFIHLLQSIFTFKSHWSQFVICVFKTAPLWLTLIFLWRHHQSLFKAYTVSPTKA